MYDKNKLAESSSEKVKRTVSVLPCVINEIVKQCCPMALIIKTVQLKVENWPQTLLVALLFNTQHNNIQHNVTQHYDIEHNNK